MTSTDNPSASGRLRPALLCLSLLAASAALHAASLSHDLILDDTLIFLGSPRHLEDPLDLASFLGQDIQRGRLDFPYYRPMLILSFSAAYQISGAEPWGHHLVNLLVHLACTALLFSLLLRIGLGAAGSYVAALLFTVHPLIAVNVAYVSGRTDPLCLLFSLASFHLWLCRGGRFRIPAIAAALACHLLALLTKETALVLPLLLLAHHLLIDRAGSKASGSAESKRRDLVELALFALPLIAFFAMRSAFVDAETIRARMHRTDLLEGLAIAVNTWGYYLGKMLWPADLVYYPNSSGFAQVGRGFALGALAGAAFLLAFAFARDGRARLGLAWTALFLAPVLGLVPIQFPGAGYYFYGALPGLLLAAVAAAERLLSRMSHRRAASPIVAAPALALAVVFFCSSRAEIARYADEETFWRKELAVDPENSFTEIEIAKRSAAFGDFERAFDLYERLYAREPDSSNVVYHRGLAYETAGMYDEALECFEEALETTLDDRWSPWDEELEPEILCNMGIVLFRQGRLSKSVGAFYRAIETDPLRARSYALLIAFYGDVGRADLAMAVHDHAITMVEEDPEIALNLGMVLEKMGRADEAIVEYDRALMLDPENEPARARLERLLAKEGRP